MNEQPEALRLAEVSPYLECGERGQWIMDAAAELRRLHEENENLCSVMIAAAEEIAEHWDAHCDE